MTNQFLRNNKYLIPICVLAIGSCLSWCTWVTNGVFQAKADMQEVNKSLKGLNKDTEALRQGQKDMNKKIDVNRQYIYEEQKEVLQKLMELQKEIKKNGK